MALVIKGKSAVFLKDEVTENTYVAPTVAADAVEVSEEFSGFEYSRDNIERNMLNNTIEADAPRAGIPEVSGAIPTEFKASATEGAAPRSNVLLKSLFGGRRQATAMAVTAGSTTTTINMIAGDVSKVSIGDVLVFKVSGAYEARPISAKPSSTSVTLAFALSSAPAAATVVAALTTYYHTENNTTFSVCAELGQEIQERATGCRVESAEISNWSPGSIPAISFAIKSLGLTKIDASTGITTDFSAEPQPPVALDAKAWIGGTAVEYSDFSLNLNNTIADVLSCAKSQGKLAARLTNFLVSGKINPYMDSDSVARFTAFNNSTSSSLFIYVANPSSTTGNFSNGCFIWLPKIYFTAVNNGDADGVLTDEIEFQAAKTSGNDSCFITFV